MLLEAPGGPLRLRDRPPPKPEPGRILIRVGACGVCRTDLHILDGELAQPRLPLIPGHEIVGTVAGLGPGVKAFDIGD
ncbi:MAG: alcohol dehydrogenase catalytic domain-containing protein, partial [Stellaceae bacterium]